MRLAVIGCGKIAQLKYLPWLGQSKFVDEIVLIDHSPTLQQAGLALVGSKGAAGSSVGELSDRCDIAFVLNHDHYPVVRHVMQQGVAVVSEKPLAWRSSQVAELGQLAESEKVHLGSLYFRRYDPLTTLLRTMIARHGPPRTMEVLQRAGSGLRQGSEDAKPTADERGAIKGELMSAWSVRLDAWRSIGEDGSPVRVLLELLIHDFDLLGLATGQQFMARRATAIATAAKGDLNVVLEGSGGTLCSIVCIPRFAAPWDWMHQWLVNWDDAGLLLEFGNPFASTNLGRAMVRTSGQAWQEVRPDSIDPFVVMIDHVLGGDRRPSADDTVADTIKTLQLIEELELILLKEARN